MITRSLPSVFRRKLCLLVTGFFFSLLNACASDTPGKQAPYKYQDLVFFDDFEGETLNTEYWTAIERGASWNGEDQAYSPNNVSVRDGKLVIESRREPWTGPTNLPWHPEHPSTVTRDFTSGLVNSKGKQSWAYGRFEIRARMQITKGMLNAIWMIPESGNWPPEIDIAEIIGQEKNSLFASYHFGSQEDHRLSSDKHVHHEDLSRAFHVYSIEWSPGKIRWFIDGLEVFHTFQSVADEPFHLIFCPAIGPDWTGNPTAESLFPRLFEVDWVRVYQ